MKRIAFTLVVASVATFSLGAQETSPFTFQVGTGFTQGVGRSGGYLDSGWNLSAGAGYNFGPRVGALIDVGYSSLGINSSTLGNIGTTGGNVDLFTATVDPIIHLNPHGHVDVYVTGGGGLFHRYESYNMSTNLTSGTGTTGTGTGTTGTGTGVTGAGATGTGTGTGVTGTGAAFGPTGYGVNSYLGFYPGAAPALENSVNKIGWDAGIGFAVGTKWHGKVFAEARYYSMADDRYYHTNYLPVTFGFRW